jgi:hypothetical protein
MEIQKFSQVVAQLELTTLNLPLIDAEANVPVNTVGVDDSLSKIALGSGNSNSYRMCDFFGAASGYPYTRYYTIIQKILQQLPTNSLLSIYSTMTVNTDAEIALFVSAANAEITKIYNNNKVLCDELNYYWDLIGKQLTVEQRAIPSCLPNSNSVINNDDPNNIDLFVNNIEQYAMDTPDGESAKTLRDISDVSTLGGQSLVAMMRESRNAYRLSLIGGNLQNDIPPSLEVSDNALAGDRTQKNYGDSPYKAIVPTNLLVDQSSSPSVSQAINDVEVCNCSCWD